MNTFETIPMISGVTHNLTMPVMKSMSDDQSLMKNMSDDQTMIKNMSDDQTMMKSMSD